MRRTILTTLTVVLSAAAALMAEDAGAGTQTGTLRGYVLNLGNGNVMHGVLLEFHPAGRTIQTDLDGLFAVELPAGEYRIVARKPGYRDFTVEGVRVKAGEEVWQEVPLTPEAGVIQEMVEVVASADRATNHALLVERKSLGTLTDSVGRQEMALNAGSDGADVMQRVTGVSIVDNKYVFVRGLGERYSATQLNGSQIPSTQPDKKVVAMDLFPASLLENIQTEKSYTPDQPGEFAGGIVKVNTLDFPQKATMKLTYGNSFNSLTTFKPFKKYPGGRYDFWGFDDGSRGLPSIIPQQKLVRATPFSDGFTREELQTFGRAFNNVWDFNEREDAIPGQKVNFVAGNTWGDLGAVLALNHSTDFESRRERLVFYSLGADNQLKSSKDYDLESSRLKARTSATANLAYRLGSDHKLLFRNFYTHDASDEARFFEGFNNDLGQNLRNQRLRFQEEAIYSGQLSGEHYVGFFGNSLVEWSLTRATSTLDEPDLRETLYEFRPGLDSFVLADESQSGFRQFINLTEVLWHPDVKMTTFFHRGGFIGSFKVGASYRHRERDFGARRFRFQPVNTRNIDLTASPEELFVPENIGPGGFELQETTRNTDTYFAKQLNRAAFAMADVSTGRWRLIGGARLEEDVQRIDTFDAFRPDKTVVSTRLSNDDVLPSINVVYQLSPQMNLRTSVSKTLNRPEFRELAPFDFTDVIGGRTIQGYPDLVRATIRNYDVRWEWFPGPTELVSASFFYKKFDEPIERVVEATAQLRTSFRNAESAENFGMEFDFRKSLGFLFNSLENLSINANYTFVDSEVTIPDGGIVILTSLSRPLAGQSKHVFNGILEWRSPAWGTVARGLLNYQGERISDVGALGLPDIIEDGFTGVDAVFIQPLGSARKLSLKFTAQNLLDEEVRFLQGGLPQQTYRLGRTFTLSLSYSFFGE